MNTILGTTHQITHDVELSVSPLTFILLIILLGIYTALNKLL
jgi:hypothetical protein